jgi:hypothetical protein
MRMIIFFHVEENEPKEDARVPLDPARRRHGRSTRKLVRLRFGYGGLRQVRVLLSGRIADARRGTKGIQTKT